MLSTKKAKAIQIVRGHKTGPFTIAVWMIQEDGIYFIVSSLRVRLDVFPILPGAYQEQFASPM